MSNKPRSKFILQHLLECGVTEPNELDEILPMFSPDTASTVAISIVSDFTQNGSSPSLDTPFKIDWILQVLSYCLTLPTIFSESLNNALVVFKHILTAENFFPDVKTWNIYARYIFRYLTSIFEYKGDSTPNRIQLIQTLFQDYWDYQNDLGSKFEDETWDVLVRVMIGSSDYFLCDNSKEFSDSNRNSLLKRSFSLTYDFLTNSKLTNPTIWSVFFQFCNSWSVSTIFLESWSEKVCKIYSKLLSLLYLPNLHKNTSSNPEELRLVGFQLHQFIHAINFQVVTSNSSLFTELTKLIDNLVTISQGIIDHSCETVEEMKARRKREKNKKPRKDSQGNIIPEKDQPLFRPLFPAEVFFGLFGHWCFQTFQNELFNSHQNLIQSLMFIVGNWLLPPNSKWINVILSNIIKCLNSSQKPILQSLIYSGHYFIRRFPSKSICDQFLNVITNFASINLPYGYYDFGLYYSTLLLEIGETHNIPDLVIENFLMQSSNYRANVSVMILALFQRFDLFKSLMNKKALNRILNQDDTNDKSSHYEERRSLIDFISIMCLYLAGSPAFIKIFDENALLDSFLKCSIESTSNPKVLNVFLVLVLQMAYWRPSVFRPLFVSRLLDFLRDSDAVSSSEMSSIAHALSGHPLDRTFQPPPPQIPLSSQKSNPTLVSLLSQNSESPLVSILSQNSDVDQNSDRQQYQLGQFCEMDDTSKVEPSELDEKPILSFMVDDGAIITLVSKDGSITREQSFVLHVRDSRGFMMWRLEDVIKKDEIKIIDGLKDITNLSKPPLRDRSCVDDPSVLFSDSSSTLAQKISSEEDIIHSIVDEKFSIPTKHFEKSYLLVHSLQKINGLTDDQVQAHPLLPYSLRHKLIDFLIQTGLCHYVRKIDEDQSHVLSRFDAIEPAYVLQIPIFRIISPTEDSPIFSRFYASLGAHHSFHTIPSPVPAISLGILTLAFIKHLDPETLNQESNGNNNSESESNSDDDSFVKIVFSESPLDLNLYHKTIPQAELLIVVQPVDLKFYKVQCLCEDPLFWSTISSLRLVSGEKLASTIAMTVFTYVGLHRRDLFFAKEREREELLKSIKTSEVSIFGIMNDQDLSVFTQ